MNTDKKTYRKYAEGRAKKSPCAKNCVKAFVIGGAICAVAQGLRDIYMKYMPEKDAGALVSVTLIFLTALLTGIGVFDNIAKHGGAGTLVPITGFANAVSSCALDSKGDESDIIGLSQKPKEILGEYDDLVQQNNKGKEQIFNHLKVTATLKVGGT